MWYKFSQSTSNNELNPNHTQTLPSEGLEVTVTGGDINMGPDDAPKQIQIKTDSGEQKSIYLVHGTPDGQLMFGDSGNLQPGNVKQFQQWLQSKGMPILPFVSCYGNKIVGGDSGTQELINATGSVKINEKMDQDGNKKIIFTQ